MKELEFARKYDREHSQKYFEKHRKGLRRRLTNWRELQLARKGLVLAGNPAVVLDLPCGAGRFWPVLLEDPARRVLAADVNEGMLQSARENQPPEVVARIERIFQTSAFEIGLADASVDGILCMRLIHHITESADRMQILREFARVSRDSVVMSLWVTGNRQASRRLRQAAVRPKSAHLHTAVLEPGAIEAECRAAGFSIAGHFDVLPGLSMWRFYVLRKPAA
ncbi:MAG: class I SAM-dependent methyltransferase [Chromatiales bacterium]|nr:class I SAM-dependent methyltransferase [Chromatiales bacterium]